MYFKEIVQCGFEDTSTINLNSIHEVKCQVLGDGKEKRTRRSDVSVKVP